MTDTTTTALCDGCRSADERNAAREPGDERRWLHSCYRSYSGSPCGCESCHPAGSFKMSGTAKFEVSLRSVDLAGLIRDNLERYQSAPMDRGYEDWERPMVFLHEYLAEEAPMLYGRHVDEGFGDFEFDEHPPWTADRFEALCAACPEARVS